MQVPVHTYSEDSAVQMRTAVPINASALASLLPESYTLLPASVLGIGAHPLPGLA